MDSDVFGVFFFMNKASFGSVFGKQGFFLPDYIRKAKLGFLALEELISRLRWLDKARYGFIYYHSSLKLIVAYS